jgi:hypothetical protein
MNFEKKIIFIENTIYYNNFNIMKPNIEKFKTFFTHYSFSNLDNSLKKTLEHFYILETGIS